uniref:Uncharacterized protein n=1 Tax=Heterorhabditis bacteriophora TaxID=37862 RepID=A0A1I7WZT3_HETBA
MLCSTGAIRCGVISSSVPDSSTQRIVQPTPIRPYPTADGLALYQLYLSNLGQTYDDNALNLPPAAPVVLGSTKWVSQKVFYNICIYIQQQKDFFYHLTIFLIY